MTGNGSSGGWADKGLWHPEGEVDLTAFAATRPGLFDGRFSWPVMVLREAALRNNVARLAEFTAEHGLLFAPHGKTTMAPALYERQLAAGAWGITVATANQALVARRAGVRTIVVANEVLDLTALEWFAAEQAADDTLRILFWVDSVAGVEAAANALARAAGPVPVEQFLPRGLAVLVDVGFAGGRTGCRTDADVDGVAAAVAKTPGVRLVGVAGYEGGLPDPPAAAAYLRRVQDVANRLFKAGLLAPDAIVSCGGSAYFDVVADCWSSGWVGGLTPRRVLRSGAYVTHDDGLYLGRTPFNRIAGSLEPAIEVWGQVISPGDVDRVIVGVGRRDAPYDSGRPTPKAVRRTGSTAIEALTGCVVDQMDDQHAYVSGPGALRPGDLVCFGISHPCTAFDKWRLLPVVDDDHRVVEFVRTYF